jgi:hypothetical protein
MRLLPVTFALLLSTLLPLSQTNASAGVQDDGRPSAKSAAAADSDLHGYESCSFDDGLQIVKIDSLPPGVQERPVETKAGTKTIRMLAGRRIMFAYGISGDFFANVKPELLPPDTWVVQKQTLLDEIDAMLTADRETLPNTSLPKEMHGLEVHGLDRTVLKGGTIGFYLLFDNTRHIVTSVYLLNQSPLTRRFQTIEQYRSLRTRFLTTYTGCVAQNQALHTPITKDAR